VSKNRRRLILTTYSGSKRIPRRRYRVLYVTPYVSRWRYECETVGGSLAFTSKYSAEMPPTRLVRPKIMTKPTAAVWKHGNNKIRTHRVVCVGTVVETTVRSDLEYHEDNIQSTSSPFRTTTSTTVTEYRVYVCVLHGNGTIPSYIYIYTLFA